MIPRVNWHDAGKPRLLVLLSGFKPSFVHHARVSRHREGSRDRPGLPGDLAFCSASGRSPSSSPLGFISVTSTVSSDIPPAEVFIGTTAGRSTGYKLALQAPVRVRHVVLANHRISSAAGRRGIRTIPAPSASGRISPRLGFEPPNRVRPRKVEDSGRGRGGGGNPVFGVPRVTNSIDRPAKRRVVNWTTRTRTGTGHCHFLNSGGTIFSSNCILHQRITERVGRPCYHLSSPCCQRRSNSWKSS